MSLLVEHRNARHQEEIAKLRRAVALRALVAAGCSQSEIAAALGVSQPAVSQQLKAGQTVATVHPETLLEAAAPILVDVARTSGFDRLAVFGSVARRQARPDSDIDLLAEPPADAGIKDVLALRDTFQAILGRPVDLVTYAGLRDGLDDDIRREAVLLCWTATSPRTFSTLATGSTSRPPRDLAGWRAALEPLFTQAQQALASEPSDRA